MRDAFLRAVADRHQLPLPLVQEIAAEVAQRCALVANRYEPEGMFTVEQLAGVEAIGARIGAAIIDSFHADRQ